jgi:hypothetical protein
LRKNAGKASSASVGLLEPCPQRSAVAALHGLVWQLAAIDWPFSAMDEPTAVRPCQEQPGATLNPPWGLAEMAAIQRPSKKTPLNH